MTSQGTRKPIVALMLIAIVSLGLFTAWRSFSFSKAIDSKYRSCLTKPEVTLKWQERDGKLWLRPIDEPNLFAQCG